MPLRSTGPARSSSPQRSTRPQRSTSPQRSSSRGFTQHIAVFGESGSGKTVLLSSFYGQTQEPDYRHGDLLRLLADSSSQHNRLQGNYLGMRRSATLPESTRFTGESYRFQLRLKPMGKGPQAVASLVWHDYPGEWFEQDVSGEVEENRRVALFKALLESDVAVLLVDGQRLLDHRGEEERYLKSLLTNVTNGLLRIMDRVREDDQPLVRFPRIWLFGLSKSDLLPDLDATEFRDLMIEKVHGEISALTSTLEQFIEGDSALSVGEDFVLLSSARFEPGKISLDQRVGVDLVLPLASVLPLQRQVRWAATLELPRKVFSQLSGNIDALLGPAQALLSKIPVKHPVGKVVAMAAPFALKALSRALPKVEAKLEESAAKGNVVAQILERFAADLDQAETDHILVRSPR